MHPDDEPLVFRLIAYALVRHLNLRLECADAVYFELLSERALVRAWLEARDRAQDLGPALARAAREALATGEPRLAA